MNQRLSLKEKVFGSMQSIVVDKLDQTSKEQAKVFLNKNVEKFYYGKNLDESSSVSDGFDDPGAIALTHLLKTTKENYPDMKIVASGQGGDEIYSNLQTYTFNSPNPLFFDDDLKKIFPWENFYYGNNSSYLQKEEFIGGSLGLETRYPLLDKQLTQEYLSLKPDLKNRNYKAPISNFMKEVDYPFNDTNKNIFKVGFAG